MNFAIIENLYNLTFFPNDLYASSSSLASLFLRYTQFVFSQRDSLSLSSCFLTFSRFVKKPR